MLFNSGPFLKFFVAFLLFYWLMRGNLKARNVLIVLASYLFYAWWKPTGQPNALETGAANPLLLALWQCRFLGLLVATSLIDFLVGLGLERMASPRRRKFLISASILANLGVLGFFKYYNFFAGSLADAMTALGWPLDPASLNFVLPVGISFYTFQSMSYTIDVYRGQIKATNSLIDFLAFVSFFPQLVAGPIERASHLLPQFNRTLSITREMVEEGIWLMIWGLFKKVVIADNLAPLVDMVYSGTTFTSPAVIAGTMAFALQIYCDFSGYSDIARGTARLLGFDIMWNFNLPYAATNLRDFWRRWHISLSTWLRDYLYISLGGNRRGPARAYVNLFITMLLGGLWHGAAWNFVLWGVWHGGGLIIQRGLSNNVRFAWNAPGSRRVLGWMVTMLFILYSWLLFRAGSFKQIVAMTRSLTDFSMPVWMGNYLLNLIVFAAPLVVMELWQSRKNNLLAPLLLPGWAKALLQGALLIAIIVYWQHDKVPFIYFQL